MVLDSGGVVVIPTDTVYGVAARLDRPDAVGRLFEVKQRPRSKPIALLVPDLEAAQAIAEFSPEAVQRAAEWPGALTLVLRSRRPLPVLGGDGSTVGVRMPDHAWTLQLMRRVGPLPTTSANPSGSPTAASIEEIVDELGDGVDLYVDGGRLEAPPSTVVSLIGKPEILR